MKTYLFRPKPNPREVLALDPRAWDFFFGEVKDTSIAIDRGIAVVSISGPLEHHPSWLWDSYDEITERIERAAKAEESLAIVLRIDSPGGDAAGATEAHRTIRRIRQKYDKPIYAYANEQMCSAAYELGCAADQIWLPQTGTLGSVGVITSLEDRSKANKKAGIVRRIFASGKRKGDGDPNKPLSDDVAEAVQDRIDYLARVFWNVVGKARGMKPSDVAALEAGVFLGKRAVAAGLADGVAGWDKFMAQVRTDVDAPEEDEPEEGADESDNRSSRSGGRNAEAREGSSMKTIAQLQKARDEALDLVGKAKSSDARSKAIASYNATERALAAAKAKAKRAKDREDDESDDEEDDEESEDESEDEEDESDDEDDDEDTDSTGGSSSTGSTDAVDKANEKELSAKTGLRSAARLLRLCQQVTGERELSAVFGSLDGMGLRLKAAAKLEKRVGKLENQSRAERVDGMLDKAVGDGRVTPATRASLRAQGMRDPAWLKGHLKALPPIVHTDADQLLESADGQGSPPASLDQQGLSADQKKMLQTLAGDTAGGIDEFAKGMAARLPRGPSAPPRS